VRLVGRWLRAGLPTTLLLFLWVTMRTTSGSGGDTSTSFGFPFSWYSPMYGSSGAFGVAVAPLVVDLLVYTMIVLTLQRLLADRIAQAVVVSRRWLITMCAVLWVFATFCVSAAIIVMKEDAVVRLFATQLSFGYVDYLPHRRSIVFGLVPEDEEAQK
jgi:hypothetical protein